MAWATTESGIIVPERLTLAKRLEVAKKESVSRGKFFSHMAYTQSSASYGFSKPANTTPFELLKQAYEKSLIDNIIINARMLQAKYVSRRIVTPGKELGWRVVHKKHADPNFKPTKDVINKCKEMEDIIENVNRDVHPNGMKDAVMICMFQELVYDRKAMVIARDRQNLPIMWHVVDGPTIKPVLEVLLGHIRENNLNSTDQAYASYYKQFGVDLSSAAYIQVVDGMPVATWSKEQMSVNIANPSVSINEWAYGAGSQLQKSLMATLSWLNVWSYNDNLFNQDSPESLLFLYGDYDPVGLGAFQRQVLDQTGSGEYQKIPVIPADTDFKAELVKIRELPKDLQFAEFLRIVIQLKTAAYRAHPSIVNFSMDRGATGGGGLSIGDSEEEEIIQKAHEEGFVSLMHGMADWLTEVLIKPRYDDLCIIFETDLEDEKERIELLKEQLEVGLTFNEARKAMGAPGKLEFGDIPGSQVYVTAMTAQLQAKQAQEQQEKQMTHEAFQQDQSQQHETEQSQQQMTNQSVQQERGFEHQKQMTELANKQNNPEKKPNNLKKHAQEKFLVLEIIE